MQTVNHSSTTVLPVGAPVIYFNLRQGFETCCFAGQFRRLSGEEAIRELKGGQTVFVGVDSFHPNGKVRGYVKARVTRILKLAHAAHVATIFYDLGPGSVQEMVMVKVTDRTTLFRVAKDEIQIVRLQERLPASRRI